MGRSPVCPYTSQLQKSASGVCRPNASPVAAGQADGRLARSGQPPRAKGRQAPGRGGKVARSEPSPRRVSRGWKASRVEQAAALSRRRGGRGLGLSQTAGASVSSKARRRRNATGMSEPSRRTGRSVARKSARRHDRRSESKTLGAAERRTAKRTGRSEAHGSSHAGAIPNEATLRRGTGTRL